MIEKEVYEYDPFADDAEDRYMTCDVCIGEGGSPGLVIPFRKPKPPYTYEHNMYCLLCGQRYYFKSLGPALERRNVYFSRAFAPPEFEKK